MENTFGPSFSGVAPVSKGEFNTAYNVIFLLRGINFRFVLIVL